MLRRANISTRLTAMAVVFAVAVVSLGGFGYATVSSQVATQRKLTGLAATQGAARTAQYDFANFDGWQTAYAFDVTRLGVSAASDTAASRQAFLQAVAQTRTDLASLGTLGTRNHAIDAARLAVVNGKLAAFMQVDSQIIAF